MIKVFLRKGVIRGFYSRNSKRLQAENNQPKFVNGNHISNMIASRENKNTKE